MREADHCLPFSALLRAPLDASAEQSSSLLLRPLPCYVVFRFSCHPVCRLENASNRPAAHKQQVLEFELQIEGELKLALLQGLMSATSVCPCLGGAVAEDPLTVTATSCVSRQLTAKRCGRLSRISLAGLLQCGLCGAGVLLRIKPVLV